MVARKTAGKAIFVLGMNGSGTTMMLNCLNSHGDIYGFPRETLVIPSYVAGLSKYGDLRESDNFKSLWDDFHNQSCFRWVNGGNPPPLPENWHGKPHTLSTVIDETFGYFARKEGKPHWCEKTPRYAQHISMLHNLIPSAYFIHMIRDGRSCAASFHRRYRYVPQRTIYRWKHLVKTARQQAVECGANYIEVFYEHLTRDPAAEMRRVSDFLGVKFDESMLSPSLRHTHTGSKAKTIVQSAHTWNTYFNKQQVAKLENIAGRALTELGYEVEVVRGDHNPSRFALGNWMIRDDLHFAARVIWDHVTTPKRQQWDELGGKIGRAILQRLNSKF